MNKWDNFFTNLAYFAIAFTVIGQCTVGANFYVGQFAYLIANIVNCSRNLVLGRPKADKVRDFTFLGITVGLILFNYLK